MTDKDKKARDERVKLRKKTEKLEHERSVAISMRDEWFRKYDERKRSFDVLFAKYEQLQACYDTLCAGLGKGTGT